MSDDTETTRYYLRATAPTTNEQIAFECVGAPAALILQELVFGRQVCKRNDDAVPSLLKGGPARVDRISRGMALNQGPAVFLARPPAAGIFRVFLL